MSASPLRPWSVLLKLACAGLLLGGAAQARNDACDAGPHRVSPGCLARVASAEVREVKAGSEKIAAVGGVGSAAAGATLAFWQPDRPPDRRLDTDAALEPLAARETELALAAGSNESPLVGLLLAVLGVVGFVAHRRGGR